MMHFVASSHTSTSRGLQDTPEASRAVQNRGRVSPAASLAPTILVIEDEPAIARALERLLMRDGYQVEVTTNGQEALTACQRQAYTQILCDLWLPLLDGQGFYQALSRCQPQLCERVIFVTGDTLTPALQAFLAHTPVPVLNKPFTAERLRALLAERCPRGMPT
jgi:CheY-like chemotaxis protein